jgi:hypothetical protein
MEQKFNTRAYNQITKLSHGIIKKTSTSDRLLDEINYYRSIPSQISILYPRQVDFTVSEKNYNLFLEFYPFQTLSDYIISDTAKDWDNIFDHIKKAIELLKTVDSPIENIQSYATSMYIDKTFTEYNSFVNIYEDKDLFIQPVLHINGIAYKNFNSIWPEIENIIKFKLLDYTPSVIHGDMCFSNILYHEQVGPRFIDMRGSFGSKGIFGDPMYDYAKLFHSVNGGYEYIINDRFTAEKINSSSYQIKLNLTINKLLSYNSFISAFKDENLPLIKLVEGLIYIGMCARHYDSTKRQLIMYLTGIRSLNEALEVL